MYRVNRYLENKAALLLGNYNNFRYALPFVENDKLPSFFTDKILKTDVTLTTCTSLTAKKVQLINGSIDSDIVYESETTISSPSTYIVLGSNTLYTWFYSDTSQFFTVLENGIYVFEFSDGTTTFESDLFYITGELNTNYLIQEVDSDLILLEDGYNIILE